MIPRTKRRWPQLIELTFSYERSTRNTHRYQEDAGDQPIKVGALYVQKTAFMGVITPPKLKVTIEEVHE